MKRRYTALLTGTIDSSVFNNVDNVITDVEERLQQYESSITRYITESVFTDIVFAENSGYEFDFPKYEKLAKEHGKRFEFVPCKTYVEEGIIYGKSYGELKIILEALEYSQILKNAKQIYKLTGRIFLLNSKKMVSTARKHKNEFLIIDKEKWCYTNILKFDKEDFLRIIGSGKSEELFVQNVSPNRWFNLEHCFYTLFLPEIKKGLDVSCFSTWPKFEGKIGGTGGSYKSSFKGQIYHDALCKVKAYTANSPFQRFILY